MTPPLSVDDDAAAAPPPRFWAYDSNDNELDPRLRAAHRFASKDRADRVADERKGREPNLNEIGKGEPLVLRNLLSDEMIDEILRAASEEGVWPRGIGVSRRQRKKREGQTDDDAAAKDDDDDDEEKKERDDDAEEDGPSPGGEGLASELRSAPHHYAWTDEHVVLYMHNEDYWFVRSLPLPWSVIRGAMEARPWMPDGAVPVLDSAFVHSDQSTARVRTIELHHYSAGGGLIIPGHRDCGSALTISVLLSDPASVEGGDFVTYDREGEPVAHGMGRGDAILFDSEDLHNISTVTGGVRQSLVVELYPSHQGW